MTRTLTALICGLAAWAASGVAIAASVEDLTAKGFVVMLNTSVVGDFDGCDHGLRVPLANGTYFVCSGFSYMHAHNPKAVVLKSGDGRSYKLLVGGAVFDGALG
jgi:hypothetical protein